MKKCLNCNKKTMISIECKCNKFFCLKCRTPEIHNCNFDYKKDGKSKIEKNNPKIINKKIEKI